MKNISRLFLLHFEGNRVRITIRFQSGSRERKETDTLARASFEDFYPTNDWRGDLAAAASAQGGKSSIGRPVNVTYELFKREDDVLRLDNRQSSPAFVRRVFYFFIQRFVLYSLKYISPFQEPAVKARERIAARWVTRVYTSRRC